MPDTYGRTDAELIEMAEAGKIAVGDPVPNKHGQWPTRKVRRACSHRDTGFRPELKLRSCGSCGTVVEV